MPYINKTRRDALVNDCYEDDNDNVENAGELNYEFTMLIKRYMEYHRESYQTYNDIIGALEGAKLELYRRKLVPYEELKKAENGDVF